MRMKCTRHRWRAAPWNQRPAAAASPRCASEITRRTPPRPRSRKEPMNCCQNPSVSLSPISQPSTSRLPAEVTPVATTMAMDAGYETLSRTFR